MQIYLYHTYTYKYIHDFKLNEKFQEKITNLTMYFYFLFYFISILV